MSYEKVKQAKHLSIGLKQTLKAIEQDHAQEVLVANDADKKLTTKVIHLAESKQLTVTIVDSMETLGRACDIDVGAASVAILK